MAYESASPVANYPTHFMDAESSVNLERVEPVTFVKVK